MLQNSKPKAKKPLENSPCVCHYKGTLIDGTEFDSSFQRGKPATFEPRKVIAGWFEALQLMGEGAKWRLFVPSELAYGEKHKGKFITPGSALIFEVCSGGGGGVKQQQLQLSPNANGGYS